MALLQIESGDSKGRRLRLPDRPVTVGRGETADVRIPSSEISREHCRLTAEGDELIVEDLGSSNGTFVNGRPISRATRLKIGDRVTFGPVTLRLMGVKKDATAGKPKENLDDSRMIDREAVAKAKRVSDDDVSDWLNEDVPEPAKENEDTKILKSAAVKSLQKPKEDRVFESVAEEAEDIIRRHYESIGQPQS